jgi:hypothetical protein
MLKHRKQIAVNLGAAEFLSRSFTSGETIAILLRRVSPVVTMQRLVTLERAVAPRYLGWLASENATGANVYVAAKPLRTGSKKRTKEMSSGFSICISIWTPMQTPNSRLSGLLLPCRRRARSY